MWCVQDVVYPGNVIAMCALAGVACATPRCGPAGTQVAIAWNGIQCGSAADVAAMDIEITCRFGEVEVPASLVVTPLSHQVRMRLEAPHQAAHTAHFACPTPTHYCHLQPDLLYCTAPTSVSGVSELQEGQRLTVPLSVVVSAARTGAGASQGDGRWSTELPLMGLQPRSQTPLASTHTRRNPALLPPVHADTMWACWCVVALLQLALVRLTDQATKLHHWCHTNSCSSTPQLAPMLRVDAVGTPLPDATSAVRCLLRDQCSAALSRSLSGASVATPCFFQECAPREARPSTVTAMAPALAAPALTDVGSVQEAAPVETS